MTQLIFNGKVYLKKGNFCEAVLIDGGRITRIGTTAELLAEAPGAKRIDAEGALVVPAFCDSHLHKSTHLFPELLLKVKVSILTFSPSGKNAILAVKIWTGSLPIIRWY